MVSFIELGVGFNPELTGRENVYMNGAMLRFTTAEVDAMYDEIVEFAELEDFYEPKTQELFIRYAGTPGLLCGYQGSRRCSYP